MRHLAVLALALAGCATHQARVGEPVPSPRDGGWSFRAGGQVGHTLVEDDFDLEADGLAYGARVELNKAFGDKQIAELGVRLSGGGRDANNVTSRLGQALDIEVSSVDFFAEPVLRLYIPTETVRPYVEGFVGYGYTDAKTLVSVQGSPFLVPNAVSGGGLTLGGGGGIQFALGPSSSLRLGIEYRSTEYDLGDDFGDGEAMDILGVFTLGTHW